jgi:tRNA A-37 threonylcarbamoyl transferase component Bud32
MQNPFKIDGYDSFEQIAIGGMATVYLARKASLKKSVAIKVLFPHLAADPTFTKRFRREAEMAARVQHDNIVNVIDYGEAAGAPYMVMEYYEGVTLEELLDRSPRPPLDVCFHILTSVLYGLEAAHAQQLVHRDVKPANVIFTRQGGVKIADFGLAKGTESAQLVTQAGQVFGTPAYMSPEQTRGTDVGTKSDLFSLGVVAYEMFCGRRPFVAANYAEVADRIQNWTPDPVAALSPDVGAGVEAIINRLMAKDPDERYEDAHAAAAALEVEMERLGIRRDPRRLATFYTETFGTECPRRRSAQAHGAEPEASPEEAAPADAEASAAVDPDAEYRVFLESIDPLRESPDTFALKLSMRIKMPLPRARIIVKSVPCQVSGAMPHEKAERLVRLLDRMGGTARMEAVPVERPQPKPVPVVKPAGRPAGGGRKSGQPRAQGSVATLEKTDKHDAPAGPSREWTKCTGCGWEQDAASMFCAVCGRSLRQPAQLDPASLAAIVTENPLDRIEHEEPPLLTYVARARALSPRAKVAAVAIGVLAVVVLALSLR